VFFSQGKAILEVIRAEMCVAASVAALTGIIIASRLEKNEYITHSPITLFFSLLIPFLLVAGSMALNDYIDLEVDIANKRTDRPLVRGELNPEWVKWGAFFSFLVGLGLCLPVFPDKPEIFVLSGGFAFLAISYNYKLKDLGVVGNFATALTFIAPHALGALTVGLAKRDTQVTIGLMILIVFIAAFGREIFKGIMDVEGDALRNATTVARVLGRKNAAIISSVFFIITVCLTPLPLFVSFQNNIAYAIMIAILDILLLYTVVSILRDQSYEVAKRGRIVTRFAELSGVMAFLFGAIFI
jgi:geranylgeranylglycerol-phosphate geranylgeranyltransferase